MRAAFLRKWQRQDDRKQVESMQHSFDVGIAKKYGIAEAVLLHSLLFWTEKNRANEKHIYDGYCWTYNSVKAFAEMFPYLSRKQIEQALKHLEEEGLILSGNYNQNPYDRTKWYTVTEKGYAQMGEKEPENAVTADFPCGGNAIPQNGEIECSEMGKSSTQNGEMEYTEMGKSSTPKRGNPFPKTGEPIPDIKPIIKPDNNTGSVTVSDDTVCRTDVRRAMEHWNRLTDCGIKPVVHMRAETKRYKSLMARMRQYGVDKVLDAMDRIRESDFLCGKNRKGWVITFDWFVRPNNFVKVLEGNYDRAAGKETEHEKRNGGTKTYDAAEYWGNDGAAEAEWNGW